MKMIGATMLVPMLLAQSDDLNKLRPIVEGRSFDLGTFTSSGYLSRGYWGSCSVPFSTRGYQGLLSPNTAFRSYASPPPSSELLSLQYRIDTLDLNSGVTETIGTGLTAMSGRTVALSANGQMLAIEGIAIVDWKGGRNPPVTKEGIWLFLRGEKATLWKQREFLLESPLHDDVAMRWAFDSSRLVLSERRPGGTTRVIEPKQGIIRTLNLTNASPSPTEATLASRDEKTGRLLLSGLSDGATLVIFPTRELASTPKWSPDGSMIYYIGVDRVVRKSANVCVFHLPARTEHCGSEPVDLLGDETDWVVGCKR